MPGPRIYTAGPSANGQSVTTPAAGEQMAREQKAAGYDLIKIHPGVPLDAFNALAKTAREVGIPFAGTCRRPSACTAPSRRAIAPSTISTAMPKQRCVMARPSAPRAAASSARSWRSRLDDRKIPALVQKTKAAGVWLVPTETLMLTFFSTEPVEALMKRPELAYVTPDMRAQWENGLRGFRTGPQYPTPAAARRG